MEKLDPYHHSLPHVVTINGFQVLLSNITCLSSYPTKGEGICLTLFPPSIRASSNQQMTQRTPIPLLYPGYKSGLKTPVQCQFSLELARCSNSISHSNKLYSPLILPHFWKFFSKPHLYYNIFGAPYGDWGFFPTSLLLLSHRDPLQTGKCCGNNWGTLASVTL